MKAPLVSGDRTQRALAAIVLLMGLGSVLPLLAWVYGLGSFAVWFWVQAVPGLVVIVGIALWVQRRGNHQALAVAIAAGAIGGVVGTILYDVCRVPFVVGGIRLFAPISSYGLLMIDATHGDRLTETLGWFYNFANGTAFGVAYAMIGLGRRWWWAIPWALWLETMTIVTPYAGVYGIAGHLDIIAIAYGAHVFYGIGLGVVVERAGRWRSVSEAFVPASWVLVGVAAVLLLLGQPWLSDPANTEAAGEAQPAVVVRDDRFRPEWVRIGTEECLLVVNRDAQAHHLSAPPGAEELTPGSAVRYCFPDGGIKRVQLDGVPYSGGFVIVDPAIGRGGTTP